MSAVEPLPRESYPIEPRDHCDRAGAERLKAEIEAYWRERGAVVNCRIEEKGFSHALRAIRYDVRSDMVGGWPRIRSVSKEQDQ